MAAVNRAMRRQMMRQVGWRGSKAKRQNLGKAPISPPPDQREAVLQAQQAQAEHEARNKLRRMGLEVPPTAAEAKALRERGLQVGGGGLVVPQGVTR